MAQFQLANTDLLHLVGLRYPVIVLHALFSCVLSCVLSFWACGDLVQTGILPQSSLMPILLF